MIVGKSCIFRAHLFEHYVLSFAQMQCLVCKSIPTHGVMECWMQSEASGKEGISKMGRRKHQIGSLYHDMRSNQLELNERRARGQLTKAETHAKYGW